MEADFQWDVFFWNRECLPSIIFEYSTSHTSQNSFLILSDQTALYGPPGFILAFTLLPFSLGSLERNYIASRVLLIF